MNVVLVDCSLNKRFLLPFIQTLRRYFPQFHPTRSLSLEPLLCRLPINHVPDRLEVLGLPVLILQVIRMLPRIHAQQRHQPAHNRVLVRPRNNAHLPARRILDQPRPPGPLDARKLRVKRRLELLQVAPLALDRLCQGARGGLAAAGRLWGEVLPEEGVVEVAAAVEVQGALEGDCGRDVVLGERGRELFLRLVEVVDVRLVVALVVDLWRGAAVSVGFYTGGGKGSGVLTSMI